MKDKKWKQGQFTPKNYKKYLGDPTSVVFRSGWEREVMKSFDENSNILAWNSEEIIIPYVNPWDQKVHRYFVDFYARIKQPDGTVKECLFEVKPKAQTIEPQKKIRVSKRYLNEVVTYGINEAKWEAAKKFCDEHGWEFVILTENEIFQNGKPK